MKLLIFILLVFGVDIWQTIINVSLQSSFVTYITSQQLVSNIPNQSVYYRYHIPTDYNYLMKSKRFEPIILTSCIHYKLASRTPKYTLIFFMGAVDRCYCQIFSQGLFVKYLNHISSYYGTEVAEDTQIIVPDWYGAYTSKMSNSEEALRLGALWFLQPTKDYLFTPVLSSVAYINRLYRIGEIPSLDNTGIYGICIGGTIALITSLSLKYPVKAVAINNSPFMKYNYIRKNFLQKSVIHQTKVLIIHGYKNIIFNIMHSYRLSKFLTKHGIQNYRVLNKFGHLDNLRYYCFIAFRFLISVILNKDYKYDLAVTPKYEYTHYLNYTKWVNVLEVMQT
ncbi:uncharacterized protein CMU_018150 [Cryptosporidium muris RN66]|uniref:Uncharacterized protein n=1 Tax=Cryptosporidium muris (strain RN66) TaxID=441375 RepID=B6AD54_CRYMR|nr:uncharacterized protein CMU_018150 [Cryptosporidium muris RN66]EEA06058.1 hypothetical protein, conserved [Cryptosporidium muris RN66]|eukprot:XP_002140407.1 hypothetical protein [Cryptosporidium muris RN66]